MSTNIIEQEFPQRFQDTFKEKPIIQTFLHQLENKRVWGVYMKSTQGPPYNKDNPKYKPFSFGEIDGEYHVFKSNDKEMNGTMDYCLKLISAIESGGGKAVLMLSLKLATETLGRNLVVYDVDAEKDDFNPRALQSLLNDKTYIETSPSGKGFHFFYFAPEGAKLEKIGKGYDCLCNTWISMTFDTVNNERPIKLQLKDERVRKPRGRVHERKSNLKWTRDGGIKVEYEQLEAIGPDGKASYIYAFNKTHEIRGLLEKYGYEVRDNDSFMYDKSTTGSAGVRIYSGGKGDWDVLWSFHADDPLNGKVCDPFDVYQILEKGGDMRKAIGAQKEFLYINKFDSGLDIDMRVVHFNERLEYLCPVKMLQKLTDEIFKRQFKRSYVVANCISICVASMCASNKYIGEWMQTPLSLFTMMIAETGVGKELISTMACELYREFPKIRASEMPASYAGLIGELQDDSCSRYVVDEFGMKLANKKDSHARDCIRGLTSMYGKSRSEYVPQGYSKRDMSAAKAAILKEPIKSPRPSMCAISNWAALVGTLDSADICNGVLNRYIIFFIDSDNVYRNYDVCMDPMPSDILELANRVANEDTNVDIGDTELFVEKVFSDYFAGFGDGKKWVLKTTGEIYTREEANERFEHIKSDEEQKLFDGDTDGEGEVEKSSVIPHGLFDGFVKVKDDGKARKHLEKLGNGWDKIVRQGDSTDSMWERCFENTIRLSQVLAVWNNPEEPVYTLEMVEWSERLITRGMPKFLKAARDKNSGKDNLNNTLKAIHKLGFERGELTRTDLSTHCKPYKDFRWKDNTPMDSKKVLIQEIKEDGQHFSVRMNKGKVHITSRNVKW